MLDTSSGPRHVTTYNHKVITAWWSLARKLAAPRGGAIRNLGATWVTWDAPDSIEEESTALEEVCPEVVTGVVRKVEGVPISV